MTYNPVLKKWEGNDHILRQFDTTSRNSRPALISNLGLKLPQVVGNMVFDPVQMRWIGNDEEMDLFADLESSDDETTKSSIGARWSLDPEFILTPLLCHQFEESERRHHEFITRQRRFLDTTTTPLSTTTTTQEMMTSMYLLRPTQVTHHHRQPHR
jgi:hypothetical protein